MFSFIKLSTSSMTGCFLLGLFFPGVVSGSSVLIFVTICLTDLKLTPAKKEYKIKKYIS